MTATTRDQKHPLATGYCRGRGEIKVRDAIIATALLDRLLHHSLTINIKGESYRLKEKKRAGLLAKAATQEDQKQALKA